MAEIVNLNEILGEDIVFDWQGAQYTFPADVSTKLTFRLADLYKQLDEAERLIAEKKKRAEPTDKDEAAYRVLIADTEEALLEGFRDRHPELESLPFGSRGFSIALAVILSRLGFISAPGPQPRRPEKKAIPRRKPSKPSKSSRRS